ncbi:MAG: hypothetical protein AB1768_20520 [Pseudomonadota bacterium]
MKRPVRLALLLIVLFALVPAARALTPQDNYCFPTYSPQYCWSLMQVVENWGQRALAAVAIGMMKAFAILVWVFDRAASFIFVKSVPENGWLLNIKAQMLNLFAGLMPDLIRQIAFGGNGLMYVALALAGLLMMIPLWGAGARFVRAERVMVWGALLSLLFTAGSFGYDFIGAVEGFRQSVVSGVAQGSALPLDKLVLQPMLAGEGDLGFGGDLTRLPMVFDSTYFPAPTMIEVTISEGGGFGFGNALVEPPESIRTRLASAAQGVFFAFVSAVGGWLLIVAGFAFVLMSFTALLLIVFLFAALPLGFFEIGGLILNNILERYFQVFVQSLTLAVFLRWLAGGLGYIVDVNTVTNALLWLAVLGVMILIAHTFLNGAVRLMMQSGTVFTRTVTTAFGGPGIGQMALGAAGRAVAGAAGVAGGAALLLGRPDIAVTAGAVGSAAQRLGGGASFAEYGTERAAGEPPPRMGNVFVNNGGAGLAGAALLAGAAGLAGRGAPKVEAAASVSNGAQAVPPQPQAVPPQPQAVPGADPLKAASVFYAAAGQSGWDEAQMKQVQDVARRAATAQEAVAQLQKAPGFERVETQALTRAVEAARQMR